MGTQPSLPKKEAEPHQFSAHVYCGQTVAWIKMPLGTEVGLGPDDIALDGDPASLPKKGQSPQFSAHFYCGQAAGCIQMPLGKVARPRPLCIRRVPSYPRQKGHSSPPLFGPRLLWPRSPISATAELLFVFVPYIVNNSGLAVLYLGHSKQF